MSILVGPTYETSKILRFPTSGVYLEDRWENCDLL